MVVFFFFWGRRNGSVCVYIYIYIYIYVYIYILGPALRLGQLGNCIGPLTREGPKFGG